MKTKPFVTALLALIVSVLTVAAQPAFADDAQFEKDLRAVPVFGMNVLPAIEESLIKQGYGRAKDAQAFQVDWDGTNFIANIYYMRPSTNEAAVIAILGNKDDGVKIDAIITSSEFM